MKSNKAKEQQPPKRRLLDADLIKDLSIAPVQSNLHKSGEFGYNSAGAESKSQNSEVYYSYGEVQIDFLNNEDFKKYVSSHKWESRRSLGYSRSSDVFDFIQDIYGDWLGKGLVQSVFRELDPMLYAHFHKKLVELGPDQKAAVIERLQLLPEKDARMQSLATEDERQRLEIVRSFWRDRQRLRRQDGPTPS